MDQKQHGLGRISSNSGKNLESPGCFQRSCVEWVPLSTARQTFVFLLSFGYFLRLLTIPLRSLRKRFITSQPHCLIFCNTSLRLVCTIYTAAVALRVCCWAELGRTIAPGPFSITHVAVTCIVLRINILAVFARPFLHTARGQWAVRSLDRNFVNMCSKAL